MSITYSIGCKDCKKHLWIAQNGHMYYGEGWTMEALETFFFIHRGHSLVFEDNSEEPISEWQEIKILRE